jgi:hypothetical protein
MTTHRRLLLILAVVGVIKLAVVGMLLGVSIYSACIAFGICGILVAIYQSDARHNGEAKDTARNG